MHNNVSGANIAAQKSKWLAFIYRRMVVYSVILIVNGSLCIAFNIAVIALDEITGGEIGFGIWSGSISIITGSLGLISSRLKIYRLLVSNIIISVICAIVCCVAAVFSISDITEVKTNGSRYINIDLSLSVMFCALIFVLCLTEISVVVMLSTSFCKLWSRFDYHFIVHLFHHHHHHHGNHAAANTSPITSSRDVPHQQISANVSTTLALSPPSLQSSSAVQERRCDDGLAPGLKNNSSKNGSNCSPLDQPLSSQTSERTKIEQLPIGLDKTFVKNPLDLLVNSNTDKNQMLNISSGGFKSQLPPSGLQTQQPHNALHTIQAQLSPNFPAQIQLMLSKSSPQAQIASSGSLQSQVQQDLSANFQPNTQYQALPSLPENFQAPTPDVQTNAPQRRSRSRSPKENQRTGSQSPRGSLIDRESESPRGSIVDGAVLSSSLRRGSISPRRSLVEGSPFASSPLSESYKQRRSIIKTGEEYLHDQPNTDMF